MSSAARHEAGSGMLLGGWCAVVARATALAGAAGMWRLLRNSLCGFVAAIGIVAKEGGKSLITALSLFSSIGYPTWPLLGRVSLELVEDLRGALRSSAFFEVGSRDEDGSAKLADIVTAKGHVLGDIEPGGEESVCGHCEPLADPMHET